MIETAEPLSPAAGPESYGPYLLLEKIGSGGMADVFRAVRKGPEGFVRVFAVKRIIPRHAESPEFVEMFCNEARLTALLNHPNLVQVYDFGEVKGSYYLAMEYLKGRTVLSVMRSLHARRMPFPATAVAYIGRQVALGLHYAHSRQGEGGRSLNLVHRDINPANIMLLKSGGVKVLDFGIAKAPLLTKNQTQAGLIKGKLSYAAPEQLKCLPLDGRADVFSLGVTLWEMLTMKKLFGGPSDFETVTNVMSKAVQPPSALRPDIPPAVDALIMQALARDAADRPDARQLAVGLGEYLRETRFLEDSVGDLLRELFGDHTSQVLTVMPRDVAPRSAAAVPPFGSALPPPVAGSPSGATLPVVAASFPSGASFPSAASVPPAAPGRAAVARRPGLPPVAFAAMGAGGLLLLALASWGALRSLGGALGGDSSRASAAAALAASTVVVELDSRPSRASVTREDGTALGQTPLVLRVERGKAPLTLVLHRPGFTPLRYEVVPDRDSIASVDLRAEPTSAAVVRTPRKR
jgi:eukaryotic-like serine/threonine-protein kinase